MGTLRSVPAALLLSLTCGAVSAQDFVPIRDPDVRRHLYGLSILPPAESGWLNFTPVDGHGLRYYRDLGMKTMQEGHTAGFAIGYFWLAGCEAADCLQQGIEWMRSGEDTGLRTISLEVGSDPARPQSCVRFTAMQEVVRGPGQKGQVFESPAAGLLCTHPDEPRLFVTALYTERFRKGGKAMFPLAETGAALSESLEFEPIGRRVVGWHKFDAATGGIAVGPERLWVQHKKSVSSIYPPDEGIHATFASGSDSESLIYSAGALWAGSLAEKRLTRLDPEQRKIVATIKLPGPVLDLTEGFGSIWASLIGRGVVRIDPDKNAVVATIRGLKGGGGIAAGHGSIWVTSAEDGKLYRIDPDRNAILSSKEVCLSTGVVTTADHVWVSCPETGLLVALEPATQSTAARVHVRGSPFFLDTDGEALWVTHRQHGTVSRLDLETKTVTDTIPLENGPFRLRVALGSVWVSDRPSGKLFQIQL